MIDRYSCEGGFMRQEGNFISEDFGITGLNKKRREIGEVSKEGGNVGMTEVLIDFIAE